MNSLRISLTLKLSLMLVAVRIAPIITIAQPPCVAPILSASIQICACKDRSFIRIIAISTSNAFPDVATTTYARISLPAMKNV